MYTPLIPPVHYVYQCPTKAEQRPHSIRRFWILHTRLPHILGTGHISARKTRCRTVQNKPRLQLRPRLAHPKTPLDAGQRVREVRNGRHRLESLKMNGTSAPPQENPPGGVPTDMHPSDPSRLHDSPMQHEVASQSPGVGTPSTPSAGGYNQVMHTAGAREGQWANT